MPEGDCKSGKSVVSVVWEGISAFRTAPCHSGNICMIS